MLSDDENMAQEYVIYPHQVAGHRFEDGRQGMLIDNDGKLLKPIQEPPRGKREVKIYEDIFDDDVSDSVTLKLRSFLPTFYGTKIVSLSGPIFKNNYIRLEDITRHFNKPCILDIKVGQSVSEPLATKEKKERGKRKYPEQEIFGFRILGMKVYKKDSKDFKFYDKLFGIKLKTRQEVLKGLREFFCPEDHGKKHILGILEQCKVIRTWFLQQTKFRLFSSSILIVYEGDSGRTVDEHLVQCKDLKKIPAPKYFSCCGESPITSEHCENETFLDHFENSNHTHHEHSHAKEQELNVPRVTVRLVDFAHTYFDSYPDVDGNYLYGLQSLIQCFEELVI